MASDSKSAAAASGVTSGGGGGGGGATTASASPLEWVRLPGTARRVAVGSKSHVACVSNAEGKLYVWEGKDWKALPGHGAELAIGPEGEMWCVNEEGQLYVWGEYTWLRVIGGPAVTVSVGRRDRVAWASRNGDMARLPLAKGHWTKLPGSAPIVSVGADGDIWCCNKQGWLYRWEEASSAGASADWKRVAIDGTATTVAVGDRNNVYYVNPSGDLFRSVGGRWSRVDGVREVVSVSAASDGSVAYTNRRSEIWISYGGGRTAPVPMETSSAAAPAVAR